MLIFDIETEENLQCGITSNPGAKSGSPTSGFKSASAAIEKAIKDAKGEKTTRASGNAVGAVLNAVAKASEAPKASGTAEKAAATATNAANAKRNAALNTSIINFSRQVTGKTKSRLKREMKARINANK